MVGFESIPNIWQMSGLSHMGILILMFSAFLFYRVLRQIHGWGTEDGTDTGGTTAKERQTDEHQPSSSNKSGGSDSRVVTCSACGHVQVFDPTFTFCEKCTESVR